MEGQRFGRLVVAELVGNDHKGALLWKCQCDCGKDYTVLGTSLRRGSTKSCGCLNVELFIQRVKVINRKHGDASRSDQAPEYRSWYAMIRRCTKPKYKRWKDWGGRGITVCDRWFDYRNFIADMGRKPSSRHSIDRIDNNGNYEPSNCRWATPEQQANNSRR